MRVFKTRGPAGKLTKHGGRAGADRGNKAQNRGEARQTGASGPSGWFYSPHNMSVSQAALKERTKAGGGAARAKAVPARAKAVPARAAVRATAVGSARTALEHAAEPLVFYFATTIALLMR